jgi:hypothetical protein
MTDEDVPMVHFWRGMAVAEMSREELVEALIETADDLRSHVEADIARWMQVGEEFKRQAKRRALYDTAAAKAPRLSDSPSGQPR